MTLAVGRLCSVDSPDTIGTVFAVTRRLALTAFHCVGDTNSGVVDIPRVRCVWIHGTSEAKFEDGDIFNDVALLRLSNLLPETFNPIQLTDQVSAHEPFVARGAPAELEELHLYDVSGEIIWPDAPMPGHTSGMELLCWPSMAGLSLKGMSGAPVLIGAPKRAAGLMRWNPPRYDRPNQAKGATAYAAPASAILARWPRLSESSNVGETFRRLAQSPRRNIEEVTSDIETLLVQGLMLNEDYIRRIETANEKRSATIAIDAGHAIIRIESDLSSAINKIMAERELRETVAKRAELTSLRYAAILTDGKEWRLFIEIDEALRLVSTEMIEPKAPGKLLGWLEAILASQKTVTPTREAIENKLGAESPAYQFDFTELAAIYAKNRHKSRISVKRQMWAKLLTTASGTTFVDQDALFINHTLLVVTAKIIGHAILGFRPADPALTVEKLMSGSLFTEANINGVIESDFFDWIAEVKEGPQFINNLARRLSRFAWNEVKHDVLKDLYESIIPQRIRHELGEYYTPDWLAEAVTLKTVKSPLSQRVLDPSCGSGTFLFHAIKLYISAAEHNSLGSAEIIEGIVRHIIGIDVHPVAVTLARVTYLLAIGADRLLNRAPFTVPVFLGDSLQWGHEIDLLSYDYKGLSVSTRLEPETFVTGTSSPSEPGFRNQLNFPARILADTDRFDMLVSQMAHLATSREPRSIVPSAKDTFKHFGIRDSEYPVLQQTFENMCWLHDQEKDHIWGYYVRNLARPTWLSQPENGVDAIIGNPPWLVYRYMTEVQQASYRKMSKERGLWTGGAVATNQDLAVLFAIRCIELYLRPGGNFGFVMPWSILPKPGQRADALHAGFRSGNYTTGSTVTRVKFTDAWDLHGIRPSFMPLPPSVIFGQRIAENKNSIAISNRYTEMSGSFDTHGAGWKNAEPHISMLVVEQSMAPLRPSPYAQNFRQGATVLPKVLFMVEQIGPGPLGNVTGRRKVRSKRGAREREPWKDVPDLEGIVEEQFIFDVYSGENILPYRCLDPAQAVIPWDGHHLFDSYAHSSVLFSGTSKWLREAEEIWIRLRREGSKSLSLNQRLDYQHGFTRQFPTTNYRVVYSASGAYLAAAIVTDQKAVIEHKLYWGPAKNIDEARYLTAVLNSDALTMAVRPMQARGEHNPRDFDKYLFQLPVPMYDPSDAAHARLVVLAERAEQITATLTLPRKRFELQRKFVREALDGDGVGSDINAIVKTLLYPS